MRGWQSVKSAWSSTSGSAYKLMQLVPTLQLIITIILLTRLQRCTSSCIHDTIPRQDIPKKPVAYLTTQTSLQQDLNNETALDRRKRTLNSADEQLFHPIRLSLRFNDLELELSDIEQQRLKRVVTNNAEKVSNLFKVVPVDGPLLLGRTMSEACLKEWALGPNQGRCFQYKVSYPGETCLDSFVIPNEHLEGFYLYNSTHPDPVNEVFSPGPGLSGTDFVLYVRSITTQFCISQGQNVIAYATACQLDQNDRPIAGYINFCPSLLKDPSYDEDNLYLTGLHEIFHALGFSSKLYDKYKSCSLSGSQYTCTDRPSPVEHMEGATRFTGSRTVSMTSDHFGCVTKHATNKFGPVLQTELNQHDEEVVRSHWDGAFMQSSLMTPSVGLPHLTVVDNITMALFEDTGWYRINYQHTDVFHWGKNSGCNFGLNPACEQESRYFCTGSDAGCHYLHRDKGRCDTSAFLHQCRIYEASPEGDCRDMSNEEGQDVATSGEIYGAQSRCFDANLTLGPATDQSAMEGRCYMRKCNDSLGFYVRVGAGDWVLCPPSTAIQLPGYSGVLRCPAGGVLCAQSPAEPVITSTLSPTTKRHLVDIDDADLVCVDITFPEASFPLITQTRTKEALFKDCAIQQIQAATAVSSRRISNTLLIQGSVVFRFDLSPVTYSDDGPPTRRVIEILKAGVKASNFSFFFPPSGPTYFASYVLEMDGGPVVVPNEAPPGSVIAGAVLGTVGGVVIVTLLAVFTTRHCSTPTRVIPNHIDSRAPATRRHHSGDAGTPGAAANGASLHGGGGGVGGVPSAGAPPLADHYPHHHHPPHPNMPTVTERVPHLYDMPEPGVIPVYRLSDHSGSLGDGDEGGRTSWDSSSFSSSRTNSTLPSRARSALSARDVEFWARDGGDSGVENT